jgi:sialic acid synthase SpsE
MSTVRVGNRLIGDDQPCFVVAEIGINHNGDIDLAKRLISVAVAAGCDAELCCRYDSQLRYRYQSAAAIS